MDPANNLDASQRIAALVNDWGFFRDQGRWHELLEVFHPDGHISISWIDAPYADFVAVSKLAAQRELLSVKHRLGVPRIQVRGERALSEVDVTILVRSQLCGVEVDTTSHCRFLDQIERRAGCWKILRRTGIYERDRADPVSAPALPEGLFRELSEYPKELRFLARVFKEIGVDWVRSVVRHASPEMHALYATAQRWLNTDAACDAGAGAH
jgi:hypothetical protein